jgi:CheY-like chemotaxis protein
MADDHAATLAQTARLIGEQHEVVGTVTNGLDLLEAAARLDPDLIVLDISMPGLDGFEVPGGSDKPAAGVHSCS